MTTSELRLTPEVSDEGKILSCGAHSPALPSRSLMDHWRLDVHCEYRIGTCLIAWMLEIITKKMSKCQVVSVGYVSWFCQKKSRV